MPKPKPITLPTHLEAVIADEDRDLKTQLVARVYPEDPSQELEPLAESPALNRLMLKNARRSFKEISAMTGMPVEEVAERLSVLLDDRGWRDDLQEEKLLLAEIGMQVEDIRERSSRLGIDDEAWASMQRVQLAALKTLLEQVDKRRKAIDGQLALVDERLGRLIAESIKLNNTLVADALARKYGIDEEEVYAEWEESYPTAVKMIESQMGKPNA